ncbi:hypothetical protein RA2_03259 [Roseovarius sp. A-2]|uniref:hypothetical protein n=1 Tax=Roseovarius sp. A-2 TaxID=1570360 RepID=UPI0009B561EA|nr:hypothetical protein [Roseovarius sp. A-2]GAW36189.1 hypothetical protein RA2_03259 [Roseovarius sp. A-2]
MQVALHAGAHMTDEGRLITCLASNRETLARFGTNVPPTVSYHKLLRDILQLAQKGPLSDEAREVVVDAISTEDVTDRLVLSNHGFFGTPKMAVAGPILYPAADKRLSQFRQIFADDRLELFFGLRNPAMFLPALLHGTPYSSVARMLDDNDPTAIRWSELIARIRNAHPDLPITVWCNEDTPMIWSQIVREMAGIDATVPITGEFALLSEIMTKPGLQRFNAYVDSHPGMTEVQKRRVIAAFLDKFADEAAIEEELDVPGWTEDVVTRLTELYDEDIYEIQRLDGIQMITP